MEIFNFKDGKAEIIKRIENISHSPIILSMFGVPDSGKTYLIESLGEYYESRGKKVKQRFNEEGINLFESWSHCNFESLESVKGFFDSLNHDIIMYHCSWDDRSNPWKGKVDPEQSVRRVIGRGLDLSIGIFNPKRSSPPIGNYDLIISNPNSWQKPCYMDD